MANSRSPTGPSCDACAGSAGPTVMLTGRLPDPAVAALLHRARALVVTAAEEFGIAAVEARLLPRRAARRAAARP